MKGTNFSMPKNNEDTMGNQNLMFDDDHESELFGIEDIMGLDGLLDATNEDSGMESDAGVEPSKSNGLTEMSPIVAEVELHHDCCNNHANVSTSTGSNGGGSGSTASSSSNFDHHRGIDWDWDWEIGTVDHARHDFQLWDEKEQFISWLCENDDHLQQPVFSDISADLDAEKEQAMVDWLLS